MLDPTIKIKGISKMFENGVLSGFFVDLRE
jgi:hypothetical protein